MNTRLQVEHPVTELVCGLDLVAWQIAIASGRSSPSAARRASRAATRSRRASTPRIPPRASCRRRGRLRACDGRRAPASASTRASRRAPTITPHYDPMLAKVIAWGSNREEARRRLIAALRETLLVGVTTNVPFLIADARDRTGSRQRRLRHDVDRTRRVRARPGGRPGARGGRCTSQAAASATRAGSLTHLATARRRRRLRGTSRTRFRIVGGPGDG